MSEPQPVETAEAEKTKRLGEGGVLSHLYELRRRILIALATILIAFVGLLPFSRALFTWIATPLLDRIPMGGLIATEITAPFLVPVRLAMYAALMLAMPIVIYQAWAFIAPGLYRQERRLAVSLLVTSVVLFYAGTVFAFYVVLPMIFTFFVSMTPEGVVVMTDIGNYLSFIFAMFMSFGAAFEIPIAIVLLVRLGVTTPARLKRQRGVVLLIAFTVGMFLTPPDAISQCLLAIPMYLLYELGMILARWWVPATREVEAEHRILDDN